MKASLDLFNHATKADVKKETGADTSHFAKNTDLANLNFDVDKLDSDKLKNVPTNLNNLKSKVDRLGTGKLENIPVDFSKLSNGVKNDVVKRTGYNELVKKVNNITTTDTKNLVKKAHYNTKINETGNKISDHDHARYVTSQEFNKLISESFTARLKQANLAIKTDIPDITDFVDDLDDPDKKLK